MTYTQDDWGDRTVCPTCGMAPETIRPNEQTSSPLVKVMRPCCESTENDEHAPGCKRGDREAAAKLYGDALTAAQDRAGRNLAAFGEAISVMERAVALLNRSQNPIKDARGSTVNAAVRLLMGAIRDANGGGE
jgi:hypothetical protein